MRPLSDELNEHLAAVSEEVASEEAADETTGCALRTTEASSGLELARTPVAKSSMSSASSSKLL